MVPGIDSFREKFKDYTDYYTIIGGTACDILIPKNFGISGSIGVLALNCIIGGLIGGVVLIFKIIGIAGELISIVTGHFWTFFPKVGQSEHGCSFIVRRKEQKDIWSR